MKMKATDVVKGAWDALTFTRQLVLNGIFVLAVLFVLALFYLSAAPQPRVIGDKTTLVLDVRGALVEQFTQDAVSRTMSRLSGSAPVPEVRFFDLIEALRHAAQDPRITQVYVRVDGLQDAGLAQLREVGAGIDAVRKSGKTVVAYGAHMDQKQYLIAAHADHVFLDPQGALLLEGLGRYRQYYREALQDRLGIDVHLFKVGEYKSAAEPYVLDAASEESKTADLYWMNDVWARYIDDVADARGLSSTELRAAINNTADLVEQAKGDLAQMALGQKWVTDLKTEEQVDDFLISGGSYDMSGAELNQVDLSEYMGDIRSRSALSNSSGTVAVVVAQGEIVEGDAPAGYIGGVSTAKELRDVRDDPSVRAVVLRVDSPGGGVFASEQVRREVEAIRASGRPVVVSMGNTAASGGYWISMNADKIYADESTITGSIGIFGLIPNVSRALEKIGVHTDGVGTSPLAGASSPARPLDPSLSRVVQSIINNGYDDFITRISEARSMTTEAVDEHARGRVWSGLQAHKRGLVDELGGLEAAIRAASVLAQVDRSTADVVIVGSEPSGIMGWLTGVHANSVLAQWGQRAGLWDMGMLMAARQINPSDVRLLEQSMDQRRPVHALAHCLCDL